MASAQAMEEELQQSVLLSEEAEYDTADSAPGGSAKSAAQGIEAGGDTDASGDELSGADEELSDRDASGEELDQDASGEEDNDILARQIVVGDAAVEEEDDGESDDENDEDAEGEDEDPDEGVGAVKIRPGESSQDDADDAESEVSDLPSVVDEESDEEVAWEDANGVEEEEESDTAPSNTCVFCKQDEENDPSEDFEAFLACEGCGENGMPAPYFARCGCGFVAHSCSSPTMCPGCGGNEQTQQ